MNLVLTPPYLALFYALYFVGYAPIPLRTVDIALLPKPGKGPRGPENKRPISACVSTIKVPERVVYHRLLPVVETALRLNRYTFRQSRGVGHHIPAALGVSYSFPLCGHPIYIISFGCVWAFDAASTQRLVLPFADFREAGHTRRPIEN